MGIDPGINNAQGITPNAQGIIPVATSGKAAKRNRGLGESVVSRRKGMLVDSQIAGAKPRDRDFWLTDAGVKGEGRLTVRITPDGSRLAYFRCVTKGKRDMIALGAYGSPGNSLADLRARVRQLEGIRREHGSVKDYFAAQERAKAEAEVAAAEARATADRARREAEEQARRGTLEQLLSHYVETLRKRGKERSALDAEAVFRTHVLRSYPSLAHGKANEVTAEHVADILRAMIAKGVKRQVNKLRSYMHAAFALAIRARTDPMAAAGQQEVFRLKGNPVAGVRRVAELEAPGTRTLSPAELRLFWWEIDKAPPAIRAALRGAIALGGQRLSMLLRLRWSDLDLEARTMTMVDAKGRGPARQHIVPLADGFLAELADVPRVGEFIFTSAGKVPVRLETLSHAVLDASRALTAAHGLPPFRMGDLRRTCETQLASLGIDREIRAQLLSHGRAGIQSKVYDKHDYLPEKTAALRRWERRLAAIVNGRDESQGSKLVAFPQRVG